MIQGIMCIRQSSWHECSWHTKSDCVALCGGFLAWLFSRLYQWIVEGYVSVVRNKGKTRKRWEGEDE